MRLVFRALLGAALLAVPARAETLADALASAYESSGLIEQNRAVLRAADEDVAQAVAALRPVLTWVSNVTARNPALQESLFSAGATFNVGDIDLFADIGLQLTQTLYDAGGRRLAIEGQKETVLATRQSLLDVEQQVLLRAAQAYLEVRRAQSFVGLQQNNVRVITQELRAAQDRFEVGEVTRTDVALAEAALAAARSQLATQEGSLARARAEYAAAVGRAPGDLAEAPSARIPYGRAEARGVALRTHPVLLQAQHQVAAAEIGILRAEAVLAPTVRLSGQVTLDQDLDRAASATVQFSGPIYQGGALESQVRQFRARRDAARAALLNVSNQVEQAVDNGFTSIEVAASSREAFARQVQANQVAFQGVREEAQLGARTTLDVLDAEQQLLNARANLVSSEVDQTVASYQLLAAMGLMTAQNLGLSVQVYDPAAYYDLVDDAPAALSEQGAALDRVLSAIGR